jgi:hypothetical protein
MRRSPPAPHRPNKTVMVGKARPAQPDIVRRIDASLNLATGGGAPAGFSFLTLNGKVLQLNGKNLMLRTT